MENNEITINGVSLASMGTTLLSGAYSALLTPPALKDFVENNDPLKDGTEVIVPGTDGKDDTSTPKIKERDVTLTFLIQGDSETAFLDNYNAFVAMLHRGMINLYIPELERNFSLIYRNSTQFANYMLNACKLAVKFREPNPTSSEDGLIWPPSGEQWNNDLDELIKDFEQTKKDTEADIKQINEELNALASMIGGTQVSGQRIVPYIRKVTAEQFVTGNYPFETPEGWTPTPYTLPMLEPVAVSDTITSMKSVSIYEIGNLAGTDAEGNPVAADLITRELIDNSGGAFPVYIPLTNYTINGESEPAMAEGQTVIIRIHKAANCWIPFSNTARSANIESPQLNGTNSASFQKKFQTISFAVTLHNGQNVMTQLIEPDFYHKNFGDSPLAQYASMRDAFVAILSGIEEVNSKATEAKTMAAAAQTTANEVVWENGYVFRGPLLVNGKVGPSTLLKGSTNLSLSCTYPAHPSRKLPKAMYVVLHWEGKLGVYTTSWVYHNTSLLTSATWRVVLRQNPSAIDTTISCDYDSTNFHIELTNADRTVAFGVTFAVTVDTTSNCELAYAELIVLE